MKFKKPRPLKIKINGLIQTLHGDRIDFQELKRVYNWIHNAYFWKIAEKVKEADIKSKKLTK